MHAVEPIVDALRGGEAAILWSGRSPRDLDVDDDGVVRPIIEGLRRRVRSELGIVLLSYSRATGLVWDHPELEHNGVRNEVASAMTSHQLLDLGLPGGNLAHFLQAVWAFLRTPVTARWPDGRSIRFLLLVEFGEHVFPHETSTASEDELAAQEWMRLMGQSLALRLRGNAVAIHVPDAGLLDSQTRAVLCSVRLPQPNGPGKLQFFEAATRVFNQASWGADLDPQTISHALSNTPNWGLHRILERSHRTGQPILLQELVARRAQDVAAISEGLLSPMEGCPVELCGSSIDRPRQILERIAQGLRGGVSWTPHNVLLAGAAATGKTDLARHLAASAQVPCYRLASPKAAFVGETERRSRLLFEVLDEWAPAVGFVDEFSEQFTTQRGDWDLDAGASRAVIGALLAYLGQESRRGRVLFLAATNAPWRIDAALLSRFVVIPVIAPAKSDYPAILCALTKRHGGVEVSPADPRIVQAAEIFYRKGASPRHISNVLNNTRLFFPSLGPDEVLFAAHDCCGDANRPSSVYADLWALRLTTSKSFFPWFGRTDYPLPDYLQGIVDLQTSDVDREALDKRIEELRPHARV